MIDKIVDFIVSNYPDIDEKITKDQILKFLLFYRHRVLVAQDNKGNLIGLTCYLKKDNEVHLIFAIRKKGFPSFAVKKTIQNTMLLIFMISLFLFYF